MQQLSYQEKQEIILKAKKQAFEEIKQALETVLKYYPVYYASQIKEVVRIKQKTINEELERIYNTPKIF